MRLLSVTACILALFEVSLCMALATRQDLQHFRIQTNIVDGCTDCGTNKQGLYIVSYHTGAASSIVAGYPDASIQDDSYFYLNNTELYWTVTGRSEHIWSVRTWTYDTYISKWHRTCDTGAATHYQADFQQVEIDGYDSGDSGFYMDDQLGIRHNGTAEWMMCDWGYDAPQLFGVNYVNSPIPNSCSKVNLLPVPVA